MSRVVSCRVGDGVGVEVGVTCDLQQSPSPEGKIWLLVVDSCHSNIYIVTYLLII